MPYKNPSRPLTWSLLVGLGLFALSACSVVQEDHIDYKSSGTGPSLDIPPDLTQIAGDQRYVIPGSTVSASGYRAPVASATKVQTAADSVGDVRIERDGNVRWLVVNQPPEKIWDAIHDFWLENGFLLTEDQPKTGIMETDWAENRANIPQDFIRKTLGKVLDSLYSTGQRDRFRTRLERNKDGGTDIYVSYRGMTEQYRNKSGDTVGDTVWVPSPPNPGLEADFLRRLMIKLGTTPEKAKALVANAEPAKQTVQVAKESNGTSVVQIQEGFDRAWRRVGLALDRSSFTVEDRDRGKGIYFVRYVDSSKIKDPGLLDKLFSSKSNEVKPMLYQVQVRSQDNLSLVSVLNDQGQAVDNADTQRIIKIIGDDLK